MKSSDQSIVATVRLGDWMRDGGVAPYNRIEKSCFHVMAGLPIVGYGKVCQGDDCRVDNYDFDHGHRLKIRGGNKSVDYVGVIAAPYQYPEEIEAFIKPICKRFGLEYRIGDPREDFYGYGTTAFVVWNPRRINL